MLPHFRDRRIPSVSQRQRRESPTRSSASPTSLKSRLSKKVKLQIKKSSRICDKFQLKIAARMGKPN